jgi:hypothetical protein
MGVVLTSCGCFYCGECFKDSKSYINIEKVTCFGCSKSIDFTKTIDITNKDSVKKVEFIYDDPEVQLKKIIEVIKFQKLHKNKYIEFLEKKVSELTEENSRLKEAHKKQEILQTNNSILKTSNKRQEIAVTNSKNKNFLDLKQIKKIELKKTERTSAKNYPGNSDYVKIDNLNAKTAEIMKTSPATNYQGQGNTRALINVNINNINNSNRVDRSELSDYEKNLFKNNYQSGNNQTSANINSHNLPTLNKNQTTNSFYQHTKRKYNQMNYNSIENQPQTEVESRNPANSNFYYHTPLNNSFINETYQSKKFKYN